jgi:N-acetylglutamate synthase-like GNAT family acetyltransferase
MISNLTIRNASLKDAKEIVDLVNSAYRGESSKQGWTTEADLLDGIRTDEDAIKEIIARPKSVVLLCHDDANALIGCVHLQQREQEVYLGMLTVYPQLQGGGIGKKLLRCAEAWARNVRANEMAMTVISIRSELIAWYERHGYVRTGDTKAFPSSDPRFGIPKKQLFFLVLKKEL